MTSPLITPNMGLTEPVVNGTLGPDWAVDLNGDLSVVDTHNHTTGKGVKVPTAGININANLTFAGFNATNLGAEAFNAKSSAPSGGTQTDSVFVVTVGGNAELFYQDSSGNNVQLTSGGNPGSGTIASINGFFGNYAGNAHAKYTAASNVYEFFRNTGETAYAIGDFSAINIIGSAGQNLKLATGGSLVSPTGGVAFNNTSGTGLRLDFYGTSSYSQTGFQIQQASFSTSGNQQYYVGINNGFNGAVAPQVALDLQLQAQGNTNPIDIFYISAATAASGAVSSGFGTRIRMRSVSTGGASAYTYLDTGYLVGQWGSTPGANGSINLSAAWNGAAVANGGFNNIAISAASYIGLNAAADTSGTNGVTFAGHIVPTTTATWTLGNSAHVMSNLFTQVVTGSGGVALNMTSATNVSLSGNFVPATTGAETLGSSSLRWASLYVGTGAFAGSAHNGAFLANPVYTPTTNLDLTMRGGFNNVVAMAVVSFVGGTTYTIVGTPWNFNGLTHTGAGVLAMTLAQGVDTNNTCWIVTPIGYGGGAPFVPSVTTPSSTAVTVTLPTGSGGTGESSFYIVGIGAPASAP